MTVQIALLRAVNVGGRLIAMAQLREMLTDLGFGNVRSLLNSGNLVFTSDRGGAALEKALEAETEKRLGMRTPFLVRSAREWDAIIAQNPFPNAAKKDPGHLVALPLKDAPTPAAVHALQASIKGPETFAAEGRVGYAVYPDGIGRSKLTLGLIEKKLGTIATARNWNTVLKLATLAKAIDDRGE